MPLCSLFYVARFFYRVFEYEYCYDNHAGTEAVQAQWLWLVLCFQIHRNIGFYGNFTKTVVVMSSHVD